MVLSIKIALIHGFYIDLTQFLICEYPAQGSPHPRRWAKRKGHLRFPFLFELLPFPCFLIWRRPETGDCSEKENGRGFFLP